MLPRNDRILGSLVEFHVNLAFNGSNDNANCVVAGAVPQDASPCHPSIQPYLEHEFWVDDSCLSSNTSNLEVPTGTSSARRTSN